MIVNRKRKVLESLFNIVFFLLCLVFLLIVAFCFSPLSQKPYFPEINRLVNTYFWYVYLGPVCLALLCLLKRLWFPQQKQTTTVEDKPADESSDEPPVEIYKH